MSKRSVLAISPAIPMLVCVVLSTANLSSNLFTFPYYADYSWVADFIAKSVQAPRWLIHNKVQTAIFQTLDSMHFARAFMPRFVHDPLSLARALNMLFLVLAGLHCYAFYPRVRHITAWVISSAAYCFMATGYGKVYGAATAVLLMLYCWLEESNFDAGGVAVGVIGAVVGLYYLALLPISFALLITLLIKRTRSFLPALLTFVLAGYALITIFWGQSVPSYFASLWAESHFGNQFTAYPPYQGQALSNDSIFFRIPFLFSAKHLGDKLYMLFFAGSMIGVGGACYEAARFVSAGRRVVERAKSLSAMDVFCWLSFVAYLVILVGYLSKIGPRGDLPFYSPFIVPFTFLWMQLRRARGAGDVSSRLAVIGQLAYMVVVVLWSGILGPPDI